MRSLFCSLDNYAVAEGGRGSRAGACGVWQCSEVAGAVNRAGAPRAGRLAPELGDRVGGQAEGTHLAARSQRPLPQGPGFVEAGPVGP